MRIPEGAAHGLVAMVVDHVLLRRAASTGGIGILLRAQARERRFERFEPVRSDASPMNSTDMQRSKQKRP